MVTTLDPIRPDSDYGTSKAFGEAVARQYHELYGIESICLNILSGFFRPCSLLIELSTQLDHLFRRNQRRHLNNQ